MTAQKRGASLNEQEGSSVGSFGPAMGGIPPSLAVSGEGLTDNVSDSYSLTGRSCGPSDAMLEGPAPPAVA